MLRVTKIDDIEINKELFLVDFYNGDDYIGNIVRLINNKIVYFEDKALNKQYTISTNNTGWIHKDVLDRLLNLAKNKHNIKIKFSNDEEVDAILDFSEGPAIKAEPLFLGCEYFYVDIKVIL